MRLIGFLILFVSGILSLNAQQIAFPGAEGGGRYTTGGRGGKILFVDNLNDKGDGSLRKAIEKEGPRIIVFRVSGNIHLNKPIYIKNNDVTIAGQTAPGDGICLTNYGIEVEADNVIIRFIRVRPGNLEGGEMDAISGIRHKNIIIDHCSFSWSDDEVASFYDNSNFTMQWCIISESLYNSTHHKGPHGYGGIWGGKNASFHHNILSDHTSRNPRFCGSRYSHQPENEKVDYRNNVIYNWGFNSAYGGEEGYYNMVNNYYKAGPATRKDVRERILDLTQKFNNPAISQKPMHAGWFYITGNVVEGDTEVSADNWKKGVQGKGVDVAAKKRSMLEKPIPFVPVTTTNAATAFDQVLKKAGASFVYDAVDKRILDEAKTGSEKYGKSFDGGGNGIIDSQKDVGGWPALKSKPAPVDSDKDGMPDTWEKKNNLDPNKKNADEFTLDKSYTNIEVYLNSIVDHLMN